MAAGDDSYLEVYEGFRGSDNFYEVFLATLRNFRSELNFASVKSCLTFGPGEGRLEVWLLEHCAANVNKLIAVEPDHDSAEQLRARLSKSLPGVESRVLETSLQSWDGLSDPVDLVLMLHVLYYVSPSERKQLFQKLHKDWLVPEGLVVVVSCSRTKDPGNANGIYERLGTPILAWEDIEADLLEVGFIKQQAHEMHCTRDFSNPDEALVRFYQKHIVQPITLDDLRAAIQELFPDGKSDQAFYTFAVFQKA